MKVATIIIVILGVLACIGLGIMWEIDVSEAAKLIDETNESLQVNINTEEVDAIISAEKNGAIALFIGGAISLISVLLMGKLKKISALLILVSAIVPAIFNPGALLATFLLIIGAILAFFVKPKTQASQAAAA
jgi:hypothetical protein